METTVKADVAPAMVMVIPKIQTMKMGYHEHEDYDEEMVKGR